MWVTGLPSPGPALVYGDETAGGDKSCVPVIPSARFGLKRGMAIGDTVGKYAQHGRGIAWNKGAYLHGLASGALIDGPRLRPAALRFSEIRVPAKPLLTQVGGTA